MARCIRASLRFGGKLPGILGVFLATLLGNAVGAGDWQTNPAGRWAELPIPQKGKTGFTRLDNTRTGIRFTNVLDELSGAANRVLYNGAGLAAGDVDGDGLPDLFFCNLSGNNRLYRNRGGWRFEDVTESAGLATSTPGTRGAVFADLNGDGALDLLISINGQGVQCHLNDGRGRFQDATARAGTASDAGSTTLALADVDGDGSLDLYIANYRTEDIRDRGQVRIRMVQGRPVMVGEDPHRFTMIQGRLEERGQPDRLLLNDGTGKFREVPWTGGQFLDEAGKPLNEAPRDWGLAATFRDINGDHAPDLYVCNDYWTPDRLWINDGTGHFRAVEAKALRHQSASSMGVDFADIDRDGFVDFFVVDMLSRNPALRKRQKFAQEAAMSALGLREERPQLVHNTLFLNRGDGSFAEIAHFANLQATDWSWAPLFLDVDLDGFEDLLVGAGHFRDVQDFDAEAQIQARQHSWEKFPSEAERQRAFTRELMEHYRLYPNLRMPIGAFRNRGDTTFEEVTSAWGLDSPGVHQGLVYADFDRDGDLDLAVNSLNDAASLWSNDSPAPRISVRVKGSSGNAQAIGATVTLRGGAVPIQSTEIVSGGRYLSGCDTEVSFACGNSPTNLMLQVVWRDGSGTTVSDLTANRIYEIQPSSIRPPSLEIATPTPPLFAAVDLKSESKALEVAFDDLGRQPLLPHRLSQLGPGVAWMDLNGDGHTDLAVGAGRGSTPTVRLGDGRGGMSPTLTAAGLELPDDTGGLLGWVEGGTHRLMTALTGYEESKVPSVLSFGLVAGQLTMEAPAVAQVGPAGALAFGDPRGTGRVALFVAGGVLPGRYPMGAPSRLFWREGAQWVPDMANNVLFENLGIVNAAVWTDLDGDGLAELVLACEWGPVRVFKMRGTGWFEATSDWGLDRLTGLWRGVTAGDFNQDGRMDLAVSNWGLNSPFRASESRPLTLAYGQLTQPGVWDVIETEWVGNQLVPRRSLMALSRALPFLTERFESHRAFSEATLEEVLGERMPLSRQVRANCLATTLFLNTGAGFQAVALPRDAQLAPAFGVTVADFDGDGAEDIFLSQNLLATGSELPPMDAGVGLLLRGDGRGGWTAMRPAAAGVRVWGDQRGTAAADFDEDGRTDLAVAASGEPVQLFRNVGGRPGLRVRLRGRRENPDGIGAVLRWQTGESLGPARELHAGSGYWSQDSATVVLSRRPEPGSVSVRWPGGRVTSTPVPAGVKEIVIGQDGALVSSR